MHACILSTYRNREHGANPHGIVVDAQNRHDALGIGIDLAQHIQRVSVPEMQNALGIASPKHIVVA
jgi:hypothetical protein